MTDEMLLDYLADPLARCSKKPSVELALKISPLGVPVSDAGEMKRACAANVVATFRFAPTGQARSVARTYDFPVRFDPPGLTAGTYRVTRGGPRRPPYRRSKAELNPRRSRRVATARRRLRLRSGSLPRQQPVGRCRRS
jgi:hypothetical protein